MSSFLETRQNPLLCADDAPPGAIAAFFKERMEDQSSPSKVFYGKEDIQEVLFLLTMLNNFMDDLVQCPDLDIVPLDAQTLVHFQLYVNNFLDNPLLPLNEGTKGFLFNLLVKLYRHKVCIIH